MQFEVRVNARVDGEQEVYIIFAIEALSVAEAAEKAIQRAREVSVTEWYDCDDDDQCVDYSQGEHTLTLTQFVKVSLFIPTQPMRQPVIARFKYDGSEVIYEDEQ